MISTLKVSIGQYSAKGDKDKNEDFYGAIIPDDNSLQTKGIVCVIADGMENSEFAAQASEQCVTSFLNDYYSTPETWSVKHSAEKVLTSINSWFLSQVKNNASHSMMTTFSALIFKSTTAYVFHVGDSRIYRFRDGEIECLTNDHCINISRGFSYLSRAVGIDHLLDIDFSTFTIRQGDLFLMTTNGVHNYLSLQTLKDLLLQKKVAFGELAKTVVDQSIQANSQQDVTAQIISIDEIPAQDANEIFSQLDQLSLPQQMEPGMTLDGFEIIEKIHVSTTSILYRVIDIESGLERVMKAPRVNFKDNPAYIERFYLQEWVGKRINNPLVVKVFDIGRQRSCLYFIMEKIDGITLKDWMSQNPAADIEEVVGLAKKIISGIRVFHRLEMLYCNLNPKNIIIMPNKEIKIIDFGRVKISSLSEISIRYEQNSVPGLKDYMATEYLRGEAGDKRSDLFSIAVIVYEMLTAKLPYGSSGRLAKEVNRKTFNKIKYQSAVFYNPDIPLWMDAAIEKACKLDINYRYESLSEFVFDLKTPNPAFSRRPLPLIQRDPHSLWKVLAIVLLLSNLILLFFLLLFDVG